MLFRAIPPANPVVQAAAAEPAKGLRFQLIPVYGVTIPVIVRLGNLQATAGIANVHLEQKDGKSFVVARSFAFRQAVDLRRGAGAQGRRQKSDRDPESGRRLYRDRRAPSVAFRSTRLQGAAAGPVTVQYVETFDDGSHVIAET